jgi:hypothetical protein
VIRKCRPKKVCRKKCQNIKFEQNKQNFPLKKGYLKHSKSHKMRLITVHSLRHACLRGLVLVLSWWC